MGYFYLAPAICYCSDKAFLSNVFCEQLSILGAWQGVRTIGEFSSPAGFLSKCLHVPSNPISKLLRTNCKRWNYASGGRR